MASVVLYNPADSTVIGRVLKYLSSANTPDYDSNPDTLINPDLSLVSEIDSHYWKVSDSTVIPMTPSDMTCMQIADMAKTFRESKYHISEYNSQNSLLLDTWYDTSSGEAYSGKATQTSYAYSGDDITIMSRTEKTFYFDGSEYSSSTYNYYTDGTRIIEKQE